MYFIILIVDECILLRLYTIKHDNHVTSFATIFSCVNIAHVFIFTTCFGRDAPSSGEVVTCNLVYYIWLHLMMAHHDQNM
jgi:hypothetical protein